MSEQIGKRCWAIAEGYIPGSSTGPGPELADPEPVPRDTDYASLIAVAYAVS